MPSSPCEPNKLKFGLWVSITNLTIWGVWVKFEKNLFLNNPNVHYAALQDPLTEAYTSFCAYSTTGFVDFLLRFQ